VSTNGLAWTYTGYWTRIGGYDSISDAGYLKHQDGSLAEPARVVVAQVNTGSWETGSWHLGWYAQPSAPLPSGFGNDASMSISCPQQGNLDGADCTSIGGWAWDANTPNAAVSVDIYDGATLLATVPGNLYDQNLAVLSFGNGYHRFSYPTPAQLQDGQTHTVSVKVHGSGLEIANSPRVLVGSCQPMNFYTLQPCRLIDTRNPPGSLGGPALQGLGARAFPLGGSCGVPASAKALSVNITVTGSTSNGSLVLYRSDLAGAPLARMIAYSANQTRASNSVIALDLTGSATAFANQPPSTSLHLILDVNGYFQ
jgi:hypothetical protein